MRRKTNACASSTQRSVASSARTRALPIRRLSLRLTCVMKSRCKLPRVRAMPRSSAGWSNAMVTSCSTAHPGKLRLPCCGSAPLPHSARGDWSGPWFNGVANVRKTSHPRPHQGLHQLPHQWLHQALHQALNQGLHQSPHQWLLRGPRHPLRNPRRRQAQPLSVHANFSAAWNSRCPLCPLTARAQFKWSLRPFELFAG